MIHRASQSTGVVVRDVKTSKLLVNHCVSRCYLSILFSQGDVHVFSLVTVTLMQKAEKHIPTLIMGR